MATPVRRTQAERVEETRTRLLDATVASLVDVGYADLTTRDVAELAGVSRGAQTHHFPTKRDLVAAAIERLFAQQEERFWSAFEGLPVAERDAAAAVRLMWEIVSGPAYAAVLEVTVAARTDPELRVVVQAVAVTFEAAVVTMLLEIFPVFGGDEAFARTLLHLGINIAQGAAISSYSGFADPRQTMRMTEAVAGLITPDTFGMVRGILDALD